MFKNPRGREIGLARRISPTDAGRNHPLLRGRPPAYDALCSHIDIVALPPSGVALASNEMSSVQAAEIVFEGGVFWGVQYHPEYGFGEVAAIIERRAAALAREGFIADEPAARAYARDLRALDETPAPLHVAWRLGVAESALTGEARRLELANFVAERVLPKKSERGRA